jgi:hypothetical protein
VGNFSKDLQKVLDDVIDRIKSPYFEVPENWIFWKDKLRNIHAMEKTDVKILRKIIPHVDDEEKKKRTTFVLNNLLTQLKVVKTTTLPSGQQKQVSKNIKLLEAELISILEKIKSNLDAKVLMEELDREIEHYLVNLPIDNLSYAQKEIMSLLKKIVNSISKKYNSKDTFLYLANRVCYEFWVIRGGNKHHDKVFCDSFADKDIEDEQFKLDLKKLIDLLERIHKKYLIDFTHFFSAYSAYRAQLIYGNSTKLDVYLKFYKLVSKVETNAYNDKIGTEIPVNLHLAWWYTLGGDIVEDCSNSNFNFYIPQIVIDYYALQSIEKDLNSGKFNLIFSMERLFAMLKKGDLSHRYGIYHKVLLEMFENIPIKKRRFKFLGFLGVTGTWIKERLLNTKIRET